VDLQSYEASHRDVAGSSSNHGSKQAGHQTFLITE